MRWGLPVDHTPMTIPWGLRFSVSPVVWTQEFPLQELWPNPWWFAWRFLPFPWASGSPPASGRRPSCGETWTLCLPTLPYWLHPWSCFFFVPFYSFVFSFLWLHQIFLKKYISPTSKFPILGIISVIFKWIFIKVRSNLTSWSLSWTMKETWCFLGCHNRIPQTGWFKQQKFIFS